MKRKAKAKAKAKAKSVRPRSKAGARGRPRSAPHARTPKAARPKLLSGGNPQIATGHGDAPLRAYIHAMPGWKRDVGRRLDALITRTVPEVRKAVKWNSPFYGVTGRGWFVALHCFTHYVKVTFFRGAALQPPPPEPSKDPDVRYLHVHEQDALDERTLTAWMRQAAALPGWLTADIRE